MKVNNLAVLSGKILAPKIDEQKEISACLSSLDYQISSHIKKLVALKRYKKGLAQQLFPIEGENVPRLRFPDFRNTNEWQETILGNLVKISTGKKNTQDRVENGKYPFFVRSDTIERINSYSFDGEAILTAGDGVGVGKVFHYINGRFDIHQRVYKLTNFCNKIIGRFLFEEFRKNFKKRVFQMSAKNSVDSIRMEMLFEMPILFPSIPEQIKISNCLSSLDELITAQYKKIESLKMHKNSLMQQLFPNVTEKV
jgi:type I restriction enzyme S subunit